MTDSTELPGMGQVIAQIEPDDLEYARRVASEHGVTLEEEEGFLDPLSITVLLMGGALAVTTVHLIIEEHRGGQIIDLRPNANPIAKRDKALQYGLVLLRTTDGQVKIEVYEPKSMFGQVLDTLRGMVADLAGKTTVAVEKAAQSAVAGKAAVSSTVSA